MIFTELGVAARADPLTVVRVRVAVMTRAVPVPGVKVMATVWLLVTPTQPATMLKTKGTGTVVEPTVAAAGAVPRGVRRGRLGVTVVETAPVASKRFMVSAVGPTTVSQESVTALLVTPLAMRVAAAPVWGEGAVAAVRIPAPIESASPACRTVEKCFLNICRLFPLVPASLQGHDFHIGTGTECERNFAVWKD